MIARNCRICSTSFTPLDHHQNRITVCLACKRIKSLCECGCGREVSSIEENGIPRLMRFIRGHSFTGKHQSEEVCRKSREYHHTKETRKRMVDMKIGSKRSASAKKAVSIGMLNRWKNPTEAMLGAAEKLSLALRRGYASGKISIPVYKRHSRCLCGWIKTKKGGRLYFRSGWERDFVKLLDIYPSVTSFVSMPFRISYMFERKWHTYFPDFLANLTDGRRFLVELKGNTSDPKWSYKEKAAIKFCHKNGLEFRVTTENVRELKHLSEVLQ